MKNKKILIISIVIAIFLIITIGVLYFATDLFKTDKQLFYKYMSEVELVDTEFVNQYQLANEKVTKNSNSSSTNISFKATNPNTNEAVNSQELFKITSNGLKNVPLKQSYRDFTLSSNNQNLSTLKYIRDDNTYGVQIDNIVTKYIAVENSNLKELFTKLGVKDITQVPNSIPTNLEEIFKIDEQTLDTLNKTYLTVIFENIDETHFYKEVNEDKTVTIGVSLSEQELYNLIKIILETAKNDNVLLNLIDSKLKLLGITNITIEDIQLEIQTLINDNEVATYSTEKDFIKLSLIKKGKSVIEIDLEMIDTTEKDILKMKVDFSKANQIIVSMMENDVEQVNVIINYTYDSNNINLSFETSATENEVKSTVKTQYQISNYATDDILENCVMEFKNSENEPTYQINLSNEVKLKQDVQISKLTTENSAKLNDMSKEELQQLFIAIGRRVVSLYGNNIRNINGLMTGTNNTSLYR